jgi:hypothetical protein
VRVSAVQGSEEFVGEQSDRGLLQSGCCKLLLLEAGS